jgi:hypothetical protein
MRLMRLMRLARENEDRERKSDGDRKINKVRWK